MKKLFSIAFFFIAFCSQCFASQVVGSNSTSTPLDNGESFIGGWQDVGDNASITVKVVTDQAATLQIDFSDDTCTHEVNDLDYVVAANVPEVHRLAATSACFRVYLLNDSGSNQTTLEITSTIGDAGLLTAPLSLPLQSDSDAVVVRQSSDPFEIAKNQINGISHDHKFGRNPDVGTSFEPITSNGIYQTPQVSGATTLRVKAGNAADTAAGAGAREITIVGLDETGALTSEALATAGESASSATTTTWLRVFRAWVSASGSYATASSGSHTADIVIETTGGTEWTRIISSGFSRAQTQVCAYTVPLGKTMYILDYRITSDSNKAIDVALFQRRNILETAAPYEAMRVVDEFTGVTGFIEHSSSIPIGPFPALTDVGYMTKAASTADVACDFEFILVDE